MSIIFSLDFFISTTYDYVVTLLSPELTLKTSFEFISILASVLLPEPVTPRRQILCECESLSSSPSSYITEVLEDPSGFVGGEA